MKRHMTSSSTGYDLTPLASEEIVTLAQDLSPEERHVLLSQGTERPFCGIFLDNKKKGVYVCRLCGLPLFRSDTKFDSGTGWPSFFAPFDPKHVAEITDNSLFMRRTEVVCARCGGHLGHVFDDGPNPTGKRDCITACALELAPD